MNKLFNLALVAILCFTSTAWSRDVKTNNKRDSHMLIVVDQVQEGTYSFRFCNKLTNECEQIGKKASYTKDELNKMIKNRKIRAGVTGAVEGVTFAASGFFGVQVLFAGIIGNSLPYVLGSVAAIVAVPVLGATFGSINPVKQWKTTKALSDQVLNGKGELAVATDDIYKFANTLESLLGTAQP